MEFNIGICTKRCTVEFTVVYVDAHLKMYVKFYLRIKIIPITRLQAEKKTVIPKYEKNKGAIIIIIIIFN